MSELCFDTLLWLWHALFQSSLLLACGWGLSHWIGDALQRSRLAHTTVVCSLLVPAVSPILPHLTALPKALPAWMPLVDVDPGLHFHAPWARWFAVAITAIWLAGAALQLARVMVAWIRIRRVLAVTRAAGDIRIDLLLRRIAPDHSIELRVLPGLDAPFCWQVQHPVIVLPEMLLERPDQDLELLFRHELAHLRFGHPLQLFLEQLVLAVLWFHPLVRYAASQARRWREIACDEWAVASRGSGRQFACLLIELAERAAAPQRDAWRLSSLGSDRDLRARLLRLTSTSARRPTHSRGRCLLLAVAAILFATVRIGGPRAEHPDQRWLHWPKGSAFLLDLAGIQVVDFNLQRAEHDWREQVPEHRSAHRGRK